MTDLAADLAFLKELLNSLATQTEVVLVGIVDDPINQLTQAFTKVQALLENRASVMDESSDLLGGLIG